MSLNIIVNELKNLKEVFNFYQGQVSKGISKLEELIKIYGKKSGANFESNFQESENEDSEMIDVVENLNQKAQPVYSKIEFPNEINNFNYNLQPIPPNNLHFNNIIKENKINSVEKSLPLRNSTTSSFSYCQKENFTDPSTSKTAIPIQKASSRASNQRSSTPKRNIYYNPKDELTKKLLLKKVGNTSKFRIGQVESLILHYREEIFIPIEKIKRTDSAGKNQLHENLYTMTIFKEDEKLCTGYFFKLPLMSSELRAEPFDLNSEKAFIFFCFSSRTEFAELNKISSKSMEELLKKSLTDKTKLSPYAFYVKDKKVFHLEAEINLKKERIISLESNKKELKDGVKSYKKDILLNKEKKLKDFFGHTTNFDSFKFNIGNVNNNINISNPVGYEFIQPMFENQPYNNDTYSNQTIDSYSSGVNNFCPNNFNSNMMLPNQENSCLNQAPPNFYGGHANNYELNSFNNFSVQANINNSDSHNNIFQGLNFLNQPITFQANNSNFSFPQQNNYY